MEAKKPRGKPFAKGHDPRRRQWTVAECSRHGAKGFRVALTRWPDLYGYLLCRIRSRGRERRTKARCE